METSCARSDLTSVVATYYRLGVSTRRMDKLVQSLGITGLARSQVTTMATAGVNAEKCTSNCSSTVW